MRLAPVWASGVLPRRLNGAFGRDRRVKGMNRACHRDKDNGFDGNKQGLDMERTGDTRRRLLSDRAPLTVLPGNTRLFSPESSRVWVKPGCFYLWYSRTKVVIYRKSASRREASSPEECLSPPGSNLSIIVPVKDEWYEELLLNVGWGCNSIFPLRWIKKK